MNPSAIRTQRTPNPNALKFTLDRRVVEGSSSKSFNDPAGAAADPVAGPIFQLGDVTGVFMADDFITVIKAPAASWDALMPRVTAVLERVFP
jgi:scaffold Nfu/NifU family protein